MSGVMGRPRGRTQGLLANDGLCPSFCPSSSRPWGQWLFLIGVSPFKGKGSRGEVTTLFWGQVPVSAADCDFRAWSGGSDVRGAPWGCPLRVVSQVRVAAGGDGWARPVLPTLPQYSPQLRKLGPQPASSTWHGVSEAH